MRLSAALRFEANDRPAVAAEPSTCRVAACSRQYRFDCERCGERRRCRRWKAAECGPRCQSSVRRRDGISRKGDLHFIDLSACTIIYAPRRIFGSVINRRVDHAAAAAAAVAAASDIPRLNPQISADDKRIFSSRISRASGNKIK